MSKVKLSESRTWNGPGFDPIQYLGDESTLQIKKSKTFIDVFYMRLQPKLVLKMTNVILSIVFSL